MLRRLPLLALILAVPALAAAQSDYDRARAAFDALKKNATPVPGARSQPYKTRSVKVGDARFDIVGDCTITPVPNYIPAKPPIRCGIAVWFQLAANGRFVNPVKHKWSPRERFYIWIEPAVPCTISLHQNYPDDRPPSRQIYPDSRYPATFASFLPGRASKLPVTFKMDDDLRKEIMSMVVVRADSGLLPVVKPNAISSSTSGPGGVFRKTSDLLTTFNDEANAKGTIRGSSSRFDIVGPGPSAPVISTKPADVKFFMLGPGKSHQFQLTLYK